MLTEYELLPPIFRLYFMRISVTVGTEDGEAIIFLQRHYLN